MSECVVRMEMPHDGLCDLEQTLIYGLSTYCAVNGGRCNYSDTGTRPDYCPIVCSLPEGHGRLVDADKLEDDMKARKAFFGRKSDPQCLVEDAATIVPADASDAVTPTDTPTDIPTVPAERSET